MFATQPSASFSIEFRQLCLLPPGQFSNLIYYSIPPFIIRSVKCLECLITLYMVRNKLPRFTQLLQFSQSDPIPLEISSNFVGCDQKVWVYMCLCVSCAESTKTNKKCNPAKCRVAGRQVLPPNRTNTSSRGKPASTFPNPRR